MLRCRPLPQLSRGWPLAANLKGARDGILIAVWPSARHGCSWRVTKGEGGGDIRASQWGRALNYTGGGGANCWGEGESYPGGAGGRCSRRAYGG